MADDIKDDVVTTAIQALLTAAIDKPHHATTIIMLFADCIKKKLPTITWLCSGAKAFNKHTVEKIKVGAPTTKTEILKTLLNTMDE
jgi:hypothetical protein